MKTSERYFNLKLQVKDGAVYFNGQMRVAGFEVKLTARLPGWFLAAAPTSAFMVALRLLLA